MNNIYAKSALECNSLIFINFPEMGAQSPVENGGFVLTVEEFFLSSLLKKWEGTARVFALQPGF
jgi:hypothetical protein